MGKFAESVSGWFSSIGTPPVDPDITHKGVVWNAKGEMQSCLFCDFAQHTKEKKLLYEDDLVVAFSPLKAAAKQHLLVIPKRHVGTVGDIRPEDGGVLRHMRAIAEKLLNCDASNTQFSFHIPPWNSIDHLHLHAFETPFLSWLQRLRFSEGKPWCASYERVESNFCSGEGAQIADDGGDEEKKI